VPQYARYRAPAESGQTLVSPPWNELGSNVATAQAWRCHADLAILGRPLCAFARQARREIVGAAAAYVASYNAAFADRHDVSVAAEAPRIVTGHQPGLFHPGVWVKNFATAELAGSCGGAGLSLVIDGDACRSTAIRLPGGTLEQPRFASCQFDALAETVPWEERVIVDDRLWQTFADRVRMETAALLPERLLDDWWTTALERGAAMGKIGPSLSQARHVTELAWGCQNLELPQSRMCQSLAFRQFACHVMRELPRFAEAYNGALGDYRRAHHIRNRAHPVSNLKERDSWLQTPFWVWTADNPRRRSLYVRQRDGELVASDRSSFERMLPGLADGEADEAVETLASWERAGVKLRSRALVTTMFARIALADLFIHGIGGAKYDEATDAICERFFGSAPPQYATISGTLRLPVARTGVEANRVTDPAQQLRELTYHPERYLTANSSLADDQAARLVALKHHWVSTPKTPANAAERHEAIVGANRGLQPFVAAKRAAFEKQLAAARQRSRADRVLNSREYAFCLFPRDALRQFLLDFPHGMR
jgi:hypothetical protein